jgi:hypothetical protein
MLERCLHDLEERIDEEVERQLYAEWLDFTEGRFEGDVFTPRRSRLSPSRIDWPAVSVNEAIDDFDKMALQQFGMCSDALAQGSGQLLCVRSNYGTCILPSLFGAEMFYMDEKANTLPACWPLGDKDRIRRVVDAGVPDLHRSLGGKALEMGGRFAAIREKYPKIGRYIHAYHPDLQGPMDLCEVLWGSGLFTDVVDDPGLVKGMLGLLTETYTRYLREWLDVCPPVPGPGGEEGCRVHWSMMHKGQIMLRDDSAMNFSPAMFDEFIRPYDQRLLDEFGGGAVHFCGKGDHYIHKAVEMRDMHAIAMSQPEYNDMETIYRHTVDRGIKLLGLGRDAADEALARGRDLHGCVHCWEPSSTATQGALA